MMESNISFKLQNRIARIAGLLYTLMIPLSAFGIMYIPNVFVTEGNADMTITKILAHAGIFQLCTLSALVVQVCHIFIVLLLYKLLKPVNKNMAGLMVLFMLVSIPITMVNELNNFAALFIAHNSVTTAGIIADQTKNLLFLFFQLHKYGIMISGIFWGLWLLPMGYLVYKSHILPKVLGIVLVIASLFYVCDSFFSLGIPGYTETAIAAIIKIPLYGEILFPLWLLFRGVKPSLDTAQ